MNYKDWPKFTFAGNDVIGYCIKVYDGDTATICMELFGQRFKYNCRLAGIDTAELRDKDPEVKNLAIGSRDYLASLILNKTIRVVCGHNDKYGRILVDIYLDNMHINQHMIDKGYALQYDGKKKSGGSEILENYRSIVRKLQSTSLPN